MTGTPEAGHSCGMGEACTHDLSTPETADDGPLWPSEVGPCPVHPDCPACYRERGVWYCSTECGRRCQ